ncbi:MAG: RNA polymerase sigma-70 factor [Bacteroides sp.]|nr:RNA polymerase sigma-70 factor [Bacteroides sp.]
MRFEEIYVAWYSRLKFFASEYVTCEADAENIVQDVFVNLYQKKIYEDDGINLVTYLFTSIKNRCIDHIRHKLVETEAIEHIRKEHELSLQMKYDSLKAFDVGFSSDEQLERLIRKAINDLPQRCREVFIRNKIQGKKQQVVADELGISVKTVEAQMTIAYKKLREELKDYLPLLLFLFT